MQSGRSADGRIKEKITCIAAIIDYLCFMKLKLIPPAPGKTAKQKAVDNGFGNPIGWWQVTTEGDCEGRSTKQLGDFYGHVAEIAFHLANKCGYTLQFHPLTRETGTRATLQATSDHVWISLDIASGTWGMTHEVRAEWMRKFLDTQDIEIRPNSPCASYYAGTYLILKK